MVRYFLFAGGILLGMPLLVLLGLVPRTPITLAGILYLVGFLLIAIGMVLAPCKTSASLALILTGCAFAFGTMAIRILFPPAGTRLHMITLPGQTGPRLANRILNEQDAVFFGAQAAPYLGVVTANEKVSLLPAFSQAYRQMKLDGATPLSPFLTSYLNLQQPDKFDVLVAEPKSRKSPGTAILFLHGYGGNFTVQCWLIAQAAERIDALTICPSTAVNGQWWNSRGQSILEETLRYVHQRGVKRIYLAGLSNGGIGSSRLADRYKNDLAGLILISGADPAATMTGLPTLVIQGRADERIPTPWIEQYVAAAGPNTTYRLFEGDHFLLLKQANNIQEVIAQWLRDQEASAK